VLAVHEGHAAQPQRPYYQPLCYSENVNVFKSIAILVLKVTLAPDSEMTAVVVVPRGWGRVQIAVHGAWGKLGYDMPANSNPRFMSGRRCF